MGYDQLLLGERRSNQAKRRWSRAVKPWSAINLGSGTSTGQRILFKIPVASIQLDSLGIFDSIQYLFIYSYLEGTI